MTGHFVSGCRTLSDPQKAVERSQAEGRDRSTVHRNSARASTAYRNRVGETTSPA